MLHEQELEVRQGIWIDKEWLKNAGLSGRLHVVIGTGEIRILPVAGAAEQAGTVFGWDVFRTLGEAATPGRLPDAAIAHDRYLYGKHPSGYRISDLGLRIWIYPIRNRKSSIRNP